jgi:hypothetical protein
MINRGKLALFKEIFSPKSIFNQNELNPNRYVWESQWIQQVFHGEEDAPAFTNEQSILQKHKLYQDAILNMDMAKKDYDVPIKDSINDTNLLELNKIRNEVPLSSIRELFSLSDPTWLESDIMQVLCHLLDMHKTSKAECLFEKMNKISVQETALKNRNYLASISNNRMFRKMAYYDKRGASDVAMITIHACRGAVLIRDLIRSMLTFATEFKSVIANLEYCQSSLTSAKNEFDTLWLRKYSDNIDLWSIEEIIRRFQEIKLNFDGVELSTMKLHVSVRDSHKLFTPLLKISSHLLFGESDDFLLEVQAKPREFLGALKNHTITNTAFYELINQHVRPLCDIGSIVEEVTAGVSKMFMDIVVRVNTQ